MKSFDKNDTILSDAILISEKPSIVNGIVMLYLLAGSGKLTRGII